MFRWDATGAMRKFANPVLVIGGTADLATTLPASRTIAAESGAQLIEVPDVNHNGFLENAAAYNDAIAAFTRSLPTGKAAAGLDDVVR